MQKERRTCNNLSEQVKLNANHDSALKLSKIGSYVLNSIHKHAKSQEYNSEVTPLP